MAAKLMFNGAKLWNELPVKIKCTDKDSFKSKCKAFLFAKMSPEEDSEFTV